MVLSRILIWVLAALAMGLIGCQSDTEWYGKDIRGLMPDLEFELLNAEAQTVTQVDSSGKINLLFFGFTYCPDICPTTLAQLAAAIRSLPESMQQQVQVLFVSVDPERDSGERLRQYAGAFGAQFVGLTGSQDQLQALTRRYRVTYGYGERDANGDYNVSHSSAVFAFDKAGSVRLLLREDLTPAQIAADLQKISTE